MEEESLFGGIRFDRLGDALDDDDYDDDEVYGSRGSEFETESLGSSSTEEEEEQIPSFTPPSRQLRKYAGAVVTVEIVSSK